SRRVGGGRRPARGLARLRPRGPALLHVRAAAVGGAHRRTDHRVLPPLPALRALLPRLVAIAALAVGFQVLTIAVSVGGLDMADHDVEQAMATAWDPPLHPLFQGIALLGGVEVTTIVLVALVIFLWRRGVVADAL